VAGFHTSLCPVPEGGEVPPGGGTTELRDHLIIVGHGQSGRLLARVTSLVDVSFVAVDLNPETAGREREAGTPIFFGDATVPAILEHARIQEARVLAIVTPDARAIRGITSPAYPMSTGIHIMAGPGSSAISSICGTSVPTR
jgi:CPA2 family monovalent cation:H+ antiporter-2